jgi:hypothetical protein
MAHWILEVQLQWARRAGIDVDEAGCVPDLRDQLLCPLSTRTLDELEAAPSAPTAHPGKPGSLVSLDSVHVLLCHLIEPLRDPAAQAVERALGGRGRGGELRLCEPIPDSGRDDASAPLEAALVIDGSFPVYALARYREPWSEPDRGRPDDPDARPDDWAALPGCRGLALDLRANPRRYAHLEVARILEAARALTRRHGPRGFRLVHLWFDGPGSEARTYARELDRLRSRIGGEVELGTLSWRALFAALRSAGLYDAGYARGVESRYFAG